MNNNPASLPSRSEMTASNSSSASQPDTTSSGARGWRSLIRWFSPISDQECATSERKVLQVYGEIDLNDHQHVRCEQVVLSPFPGTGELASLPEDSPRRQRIINTIIIDQGGLEAAPDTRNHLVICHGFGAGLGFWYRNLVTLSRQIHNCRIYAIDWLGMGRSSRPDFPMFQLKSNSRNKTSSSNGSSNSSSSSSDSTNRYIQSQDHDNNASNLNSDLAPNTKEAIDFFLDSFEEWRTRQVGLERFILLGHSMGGYLAAIYALRHPDRVQKLILASPVGLPEQTETGTTVTGKKLPIWITRLWNANYTPQGLLRALGPFGHRFAMGYINNRFAFLPLTERQDLGNYFYHISAHRPSGEYALAALLAPGAWAREPLHRKLADLMMPCVFLYGQHDWMDKRHAEAAIVNMREAKVFSLEGADHQLYVENAPEFNRIVVEECNMIFQS